MLEIINLTSGYEKNKNIVKNISFKASPGEITAIVGPNGSGKSTFLHTMIGLIPRKSGKVILNGYPIDDQIKNNVGFCADDLPLPELLTGREFVETMLNLRGASLGEEDSIYEYFQALRLENDADNLIGSYSHGMKRKVQLIANIIHQPTLLVLDEPFRGLDPESSVLLKRLLIDTANIGNSVLISTHDLGAVENFCDKIVVISYGEVVLESSLEDIRKKFSGKDDFLEETFLEVTGLKEEIEMSAQRAATLLGKK